MAHKAGAVVTGFLHGWKTPLPMATSRIWYTRHRRRSRDMASGWKIDEAPCADAPMAGKTPVISGLSSDHLDLGLGPVKCGTCSAASPVGRAQACLARCDRLELLSNKTRAGTARWFRTWEENDGYENARRQAESSADVEAAPRTRCGPSKLQSWPQQGRCRREGKAPHWRRAMPPVNPPKLPSQAAPACAPSSRRACSSPGTSTPLHPPRRHPPQKRRGVVLRPR